MRNLGDSTENVWVSDNAPDSRGEGIVYERDSLSTPEGRGKFRPSSTVEVQSVPGIPGKPVDGSHSGASSDFLACLLSVYESDVRTDTTTTVFTKTAGRHRVKTKRKAKTAGRHRVKTKRKAKPGMRAEKAFDILFSKEESTTSWEVSKVYRGYKIEKNPIPIGRQAKSAVRLHGLNNTKYCTGRIRFAARSIPQSLLVQFRFCPKFTTPSVRQNLTTLHFGERQEKRIDRFACIFRIRIGGLSLRALGQGKRYRLATKQIIVTAIKEHHVRAKKIVCPNAKSK
ncbi:hypothetical protein GOBAR_AA34240 [Gossypium barbadense]|uniref:Uncharacterized protein n=1 Tax=Gossypium barbadense TaxID=3634 RepID=A0A2P5W5T0_GOSBA|nr:hypothetical protein GOBAR_AA34240 [Gossypium barbadense]